MVEQTSVIHIELPQDSRVTLFACNSCLWFLLHKASAGLLNVEITVSTLSVQCINIRQVALVTKGRSVFVPTEVLSR